MQVMGWEEVRFGYRAVRRLGGYPGNGMGAQVRFASPRLGIGGFSHSVPDPVTTLVLTFGSPALRNERWGTRRCGYT